MRFFNSLILAASALLLPAGLSAAEANFETELLATSVAEVLPVWQPGGETMISFDVLRKGKPFGQHNVLFEPTADGGFTATSDVELTAKIGPITVYKYRHDSVETWKDGRLVGLESNTRKEGSDLSARADVTEDGLSVEGSVHSEVYPADIIPANHWNIAQLYATTMLSTEGGQPLDVAVTNLGSDTLTIAGQDVAATKFELRSDLTIFLWYDDSGRWLKLSLTARGQPIEYVLNALY